MVPPLRTEAAICFAVAGVMTTSGEPVSTTITNGPRPSSMHSMVMRLSTNLKGTDTGASRGAASARVGFVPLATTSTNKAHIVAKSCFTIGFPEEIAYSLGVTKAARDVRTSVSSGHRAEIFAAFGVVSRGHAQLVHPR